MEQYSNAMSASTRAGTSPNAGSGTCARSAFTYMCIDLKSFYASVECVERGLDPLTTDLVVADPERSDKTICLAVSPSLKAKGVRNRCRVFEIPKEISYIMATPRMQFYINYAAKIYGVYLKWFSKDDIYVYSIDEAFFDITHYLDYYHMDAVTLATKVMHEVYEATGITATCGIGPNMYLCKIAMDVTAKHMKPGPTGERIDTLTEESFRERLWDHRPLTDFWRIGGGTARHLERLGIVTMRQLAHADEDMLVKEFGIDAELLMDHAWGQEPTTMADIKNYQPKKEGLSQGQVLMRSYGFEEAKTIVKEMTEALALEMTQRDIYTRHVSLAVGYEGARDWKLDSGNMMLDKATRSTNRLKEAFLQIYERVCRREEDTYIRRFYLNASIDPLEEEQFSLFSEMENDDSERLALEEKKDNKMQDVMLKIKGKYGKNAILRGIDLTEEGTTRERNAQIGGHKA